MSILQLTVQGVPTPLLSCALLGVAAATALAQRPDSTVITGRVTSEGGVAIPLASVSLTGARLSAATTDAGAYRLIVRGAVGRGDTLRVLRIGYREVRRPVTLA